MGDTDKQWKLHRNGMETIELTGAAATGLCKQSGFVVLNTIGVARDILGELATPI